MFMIVWSLFAIAVSASSGIPTKDAGVATITPVTTMSTAEAPARPSAPSAPARPASPSAQTVTAEPQTPTGRFTTATEVKPILSATRNNWVAIREYDGQDLVYVTQIWSWRCGLAAVTISLNRGAHQPWDLPACHDETPTPNAILPTDGLPYRSYPLRAVRIVTVTITYDDLTTDTATFERSQILIP